MNINQVVGEYQRKEAMIIKYLHKVHNLDKHFKCFEIVYVAIGDNYQEDLLSKLDITKKPSHNTTVIQETLDASSTLKKEFNTIDVAHTLNLIALIMC